MADQIDMWAAPDEVDVQVAPDLGLRPYQADARAAVARDLETHRGALVVLPTGCGKSRLAGAIAWDHKLAKSKVLILCPTIVLCQQMYNDMRKLGLTVAIEQASNRAVRPLPNVTVASVATMRGDRLRSFRPDDFGLIVADECFPAGTLVGGRRIEDIKPGEYVPCVDHTAGTLAMARVAHVFESMSDCIVALRIGATELRCTPNHPIFVRGKGYVNASDIREGDVCCLLERGDASTKDVLERVQIQACGPKRGSNERGEASQGSSPGEDGCVSLQGLRAIVYGETVGNDRENRVLERVQSADLTGEFGGHKSRSCREKDEREQPNAQGRQSRTDEGYSCAHRTQAKGEGRKWDGRYRCGVSAPRCARGWVDHISCCAHENAEGQRIPQPLQTGSCQPRCHGDDRSGRVQSLRACEEGTGQEEGRFLVWARVDHVESEQQSGASGTAVYNLEVEGAHTYFANGVLVHNCHYSTSDAYTAIFQHFSAAKRLGLTATPDRSDGVALANVFDAVSYEMSMLTAIEQGWLVPLRFRTADTNFDPRLIRQIAGECDPNSVAKELVRSGALHQAANTMADLAGDDRAVAFLPTVAASEAFTAEINARHQRSPHVAQYAAHIDGTTPAAIREEYFTAFRDGITRVLSNVGCLVVGWDAPHASVIALLSPTKSRSKLCQMIGRGTRLYEGKESTLVIDFCPGRMKKGRLASPADALAGKMLDDRVHEQLGKDGDLAEAIKQAEIKAKDIEDRKVEAERIAREKAERNVRLRDEVRVKQFVYGVEDHDMHVLFGQRGDIAAKLEKRGVNVPQVDADRRMRGLCSVRQAAVLARAKLNPDLPWKLARVAIDALAANGWVVPEHIAADRKYHR